MRTLWMSVAFKLEDLAKQIVLPGVDKWVSLVSSVEGLARKYSKANSTVSRKETGLPGC